jgi:hypothetical protein
MEGGDPPEVPPMTRDQLCDHEVGLELQLIEAVEQHERAVRQGRADDAAAFDREIAGLQAELAETAERMAGLPTAAA